MNKYTYEDIEIGMEESFEAAITDKEMAAFRNLTGDENPLHRDYDFAHSKDFEAPVVYGMLTASYLSTLAGVYLPGENSLIQSMDIKFMAPVYPGDKLLIEGKVDFKDDRYRIIRLKVSIRVMDGKKVLRGTMTIKM